MTISWAVCNATLPGRDGRWRVSIRADRIVSVEKDKPGDRAGADGPDWNAGGRLISSGFVDPHVHIDKALISDRVADGADVAGLSEAIRAVRLLKADFTVEDVAARARQSLEMGLAHGTTTVRTNCEVDRYVGMRAVKGIDLAARVMAGKVDVQITAFPQEGWFETAGTLEDGAGSFIREAVEQGVRIVGGNVNRAIWPSEPERQVDETFALAKLHDCDIDYHLDNWDAEVAFTLPYVAKKTIDEGWQGRVAVSHIASLACVSNAVASETIDLMKRADLQVCVLPTRMRLTRTLELMEAGINVSCGTDNMRDPFVRFGDADPLKAMLLLAQLTKQLHNAGLEKVWQTMTSNAARMLRLESYGLAPGCLADLIVLDAQSVPDAILQQSTRLAVIKRGVQVSGPVQITRAAY
ncbi:MAG: amidohydrolase family protein [Vitreoscilla sp.]|nr:amidohydrolase family protein [Polaromonas sp.]